MSVDMYKNVKVETTTEGKKEDCQSMLNVCTEPMVKTVSKAMSKSVKKSVIETVKSSTDEIMKGKEY